MTFSAAWIFDYWPYALLISLLFLVLVLIVAIRLIRAGRGTPPAGDAAPPEPVEGSQANAEAASRAKSDQVSRLFNRALSRMRQQVAGKNYRYQIPWYLLIGEPGSGKTTLLARSGLHPAFGRPSSGQNGGSEKLAWWFFDEGVVLDTDGECLVPSPGTPGRRNLWDDLLQALVRNRPQRPIDGIIVAVSAAGLLGWSHDHPGQRQAVKDQADRLYEGLCRAQRILGLDLPVYVLVTQCDEVPGFQAFCRRLPARRQSEIFGWSNPFALKTAYAPAWISEAFQQIRRSLHSLQLEIYAESPDNPQPEAMFHFPEAFAALEAPTSYLLNQVFKESVYHDAFFLRGIYFCGNVQASSEAPVQDEGAAQAAGQPTPVQPEIAFVRDLFQRRIFPERAVARPAASGLISRNRYILAAQCAMLLVVLGGGWGLWSAFLNVQAVKTEVYPLLSEVKGDLIRSESLSGVRADQDGMKASAQSLLAFMNRMNASRFQWIFIPSSWVSPLNDGIIDALTLAYNRIILQSVATGLQEKMKEVLSDRPDGRIKMVEDRVGAPIEEMPEFQHWCRYVADVTTLEQMIETFNTLHVPGHADMDAFAKVVDYVYPNTLTREFYDHPDLYRKALEQADLSPIVLTAAEQKQAGTVLWEYSLRLFHRIFERNDLLGAAYRLVESYQSLPRGRQGGRPSVEPLLALKHEFENMGVLLRHPAVSWMVQPEVRLGEEYERTLALVDRSRFFKTGLTERMQRRAGEGLADLQAQWAALEIHPGIPLFANGNAKPGLQFAEPVQRMHAALDKLPALGMAQPEGRTYHDRTPDTVRVIWHPEYLMQASELWNEYRDFTENELSKLPPVLAEPLRVNLRQELERKMIARVGHAREPFPSGTANLEHQLEESIRREAGSFVQAAPVLGTVLDHFRQAGLEEAHWNLQEQVTAQAHGLLKRIDRLLAGSGLYAVRGGSFEWWDGQPPLAARAYEVSTPLGMQTYLESQRERIRFMAREYAGPVITFLAKVAAPQRQSSGERYLVAKWQGLLAVLEDYDKRKPGNSLSALEEFIAVEMSGLSAKTCLNRPPVVTRVSLAQDYFLETKDGLIRSLADRCRELADGHLETAYRDLHAFFNRNLAGRLPFAATGRSDRTVVLDDFKSFFRLYDRYFPDTTQALTAWKSEGRTRTRVTDFLLHIGRSRTFFAHYLGQEKTGLLPAFHLETEFRVNRNREQGGNQIIDWSLTVGNRHVRPNPGELSSKIRWNYGDAIRLGFRWAKDAPRQPVPDPRQPFLQVHNHVATFVHDNPWALVTLLADQEAGPGDFDHGGDPRPHTLKFVIPTTADPAPGKSRPMDEGAVPNDAKPEQVEIFVRIVVTAPGQDEELSLPWFPDQAPPLPHLVAGPLARP